MKYRIPVLVAALAIAAAGVAKADTIVFRNGAVLDGRLLGSNDTHVRFESNGMVGNYARGDVVSIDIGTMKTTTPPEAPPRNLDVPAAWQEGDPEPVEATVPETEPEQNSDTAPPAQPMEDDCGVAPGPNHVWVTGYWWWHTGAYFWVPGYWRVPPYPYYVYVPGYWSFMGGGWIYVRGGWGHPYDNVVIMYAGPRPSILVPIIPRPHRIVVRHKTWRHRNHRHGAHRAYESRASKRARAHASGFRNPNSKGAAKKRFNRGILRSNRGQNKAGQVKRGSNRPSAVRKRTTNARPANRATTPRRPRQSVGKTSSPSTRRPRSTAPRSGSRPKASGSRPSRSRGTSGIKSGSRSNRRSSGSSRRK